MKFKKDKDEVRQQVIEIVILSVVILACTWFMLKCSQQTIDRDMERRCKSCKTSPDFCVGYWKEKGRCGYGVE
jgi:hypothetical protein